MNTVLTFALICCLFTVDVVLCQGTIITLSPADIQSIVDGHNSVRQGVSPPAADMKEMTWDQDLADMVSDYMVTCYSTNSNSSLAINSNRNLKGERPGENLYYSTGAISNIRAAQNSWASGGNGYNFATNKCSGSCGSYLQLVWATSDRIGCAKVRCDNLRYVTSVMCDYLPAGNINGRRPYTELITTPSPTPTPTPVPTRLTPVVGPIEVSTPGILASEVSGDVTLLPPPSTPTSSVLYSSTKVNATAALSFPNNDVVITNSSNILGVKLTLKVNVLIQPIILRLRFIDSDRTVSTIEYNVNAIGVQSIDIRDAYLALQALYPDSFSIRKVNVGGLRQIKVQLQSVTVDNKLDVDSNSLVLTTIYQTSSSSSQKMGISYNLFAFVIFVLLLMA
ncbi:Pi16 [Acrasis kona]|uniref:Pi16 n=1 Tax=Acrasis kona TaxID=1008807 RepID=A0AAW2Z3W2_9EUKA